MVAELLRVLCLHGGAGDVNFLALALVTCLPKAMGIPLVLKKPRASGGCLLPGKR